MKLSAYFLLIFVVLFSSMRAAAEDKIPFGDLAMNGGIHPVAIPLPDEKAQAQSSATRTARPSHMTTGGKVMTGVGIGFIALGVVVFAAGAAAINDSWFHDAAAPAMGVGAALGGGGTALIVVGNHRRTTK